VKKFDPIVLLVLLLVFIAVIVGAAQTPDEELLNAIFRQEDRMPKRYRDELPEAKRLYEQAQRSPYAACRARAGYMYGRYLWADGLYRDGLNFLFPALQQAQLIKDYRTIADCANIIGNTFYYQAYYDSALYYFDVSLHAFEASNDYTGQIRTLHDISLMFHRKGDFKKTIEYIFKKEQLEAQHPELLAEIESYGAMGSLLNDSLYYLEKISEALVDLRRHLANKDSVNLYKTYFNLGKAHSQLKNPLLAARFYIKMCEAMIRVGNTPDWQYVGMEYQSAGIEDSTFYYYRKSLKERNTATRLYNDWIVELMGDAHLNFSRPDSAIHYYDIAMSSNVELNNRLSIAGQHRNYVRAYTQLGEFQKAKYHLNEGLKLANEISLIHARNLYNAGRVMYEKMGDYEQAYYLQSRYAALADSIHRTETAINLARLQVEFKTSTKEREVEYLRQQSEIQDARLKARNLQIGLAVSLVVLVGSAAGFNFLKFRQKRKLSELLEQKNQLIEEQNQSLQKQNQEKEVLLAEIHHRVKNNLQIMSSLINIKARTIDLASKGVLDDVVNRIYALGLIYERLYKSEDLRNVNLNDYLNEQFSLLFTTLSNHASEVKAEIDVEPVWVDVETAMNIGLINNELLTNVMKYAFTPDQSDRRLWVRLYQQAGILIFEVSDNGLSLAKSGKDINFSFGLRFVEQVVKDKLNGTLEVYYKRGLSIKMKLKPVKSMVYGEH